MKLSNIMGTNALGKSTRINCLVDYLGEDYEEVSYTFLRKSKAEPDGVMTTIQNIGRYYKKHKILIVGRKNNSGVWVGLDTADLNNWGSKIEFYTRIINKELPYDIEHIIQEGYFNNTSMQGSPNALKTIGFTSADFYIFIYDTVDEYLERCNSRSGKIRDIDWAKNSPGWKDNTTYSNTLKNYKKEEDSNFVVYKLCKDEHVDYFVRKLFNDTHEYNMEKQNKTVTSEPTIKKQDTQKKSIMDFL